jgi:aryl-alcohol dehydrogenase-like predicted oxidoreductase
MIRDNESEADEKIVSRVDEVAQKRGVGMACVATAWVLAKGSFPIVGIGSVERIRQAVEAVNFELTTEEMEYLEEPCRPRAVMGH